MSKLDLSKLHFTPELEWLAIPKDGSKVFTFTLDDIRPTDCGPTIVMKPPYDYISVYDCHICGSTGYLDSEGETVFGGQILKRMVRTFPEYRIICWGKMSFFCSVYYPEGHKWIDSCLAPETIKQSTIIGHIHISKLGTNGIESEWSKILSGSEVPEEVAALLKGAEDDS